MAPLSLKADTSVLFDSYARFTVKKAQKNQLLVLMSEEMDKYSDPKHSPKLGTARNQKKKKTNDTREKK